METENLHHSSVLQLPVRFSIYIITNLILFKHIHCLAHVEASKLIWLQWFTMGTTTI